MNLYQNIHFLWHLQLRIKRPGKKKKKNSFSKTNELAT